MARFSCVDTDGFTLLRSAVEFKDLTPPDFTGHPTKSTWVWVPYTLTKLASFDGSLEVKLADDVVISATEHTITRQKRSKTQPELDADIEAEKDLQIAHLEATRAVAEGLLNHENRMRVLEGNGTVADMDALKTFLRSKL